MQILSYHGAECCFKNPAMLVAGHLQCPRRYGLRFDPVRLSAGAAHHADRCSAPLPHLVRAGQRVCRRPTRGRAAWESSATQAAGAGEHRAGATRSADAPSREARDSHSEAATAWSRTIKQACLGRLRPSSQGPCAQRGERGVGATNGAGSRLVSRGVLDTKPQTTVATCQRSGRLT